MVSPSINLIYLSHNPYGGWAIYTSHLLRALRSVDARCALYKITNRSESKSRSFGYGEKYRNISLHDAGNLVGPVLICALGTKYKSEGAELLYKGAFIVRHDPNEKKWYTAPTGKTIVIRRANLQCTNGAKFIPHPYDAKAYDQFHKNKHAISVSRVDSDKCTEWILQANRQLSEERQVVVRGFAHTSYARFYLADKYEEWGNTSLLKFPRDCVHAGVDLLLPYRFGVDLSRIRGDGGGTQYTFLEAWNAHSVQIVNQDWIIPGDEMSPNVNCLSVKNYGDLRQILTDPPEQKVLDVIIDNAWDQMRLHSSRMVGSRYVRYFREWGLL